MSHKQQYKLAGQKNRLIILDETHFTIGIPVFLLIFLTSMATMATSSDQQIVKSNALFTNELYKILGKNDENVFFSPISLHAALSMIYQGAGGSTAESLAKTLQIPNDSKALAEGYESIMTRLNNIENITLLMANKVYVHEIVQILDNFKSTLTKNFHSELEKVDFGKNEEAAKAINNWVEDKTNKKIKDLISADSLDNLTRLVLINAIYFKGEWNHKFDKSLTKIEPFYLNKNDKVDVEMMHIKEDLLYKDDQNLNAQILEIPYKNKDFNMIIILPNEIDGIKDLEEKLATTDLSNITNGMWKVEVNVALPKFKIETTMDLKETLIKMGLGVIFNQNEADFRQMIELKPNDNLYVSKVIQKAFIEVNEEGSEAAAATGIQMVFVTAIIEEPPRFIVDHPFIFIVTDKANQHPNNNILFMGKLKNI